MKIFDILNGYKMGGRKRPIRGGFGFKGDFVYKSRSFVGIFGCKKRVFANEAFQHSQKMRKFSASLPLTQDKQEECSRTIDETALGGCFQTWTQAMQGGYGQLHTHSEQGRGMVEMLGVLAVIGILSITGILGYRYAMNKSRANDVLNYVRIGHTIVSAMNGVPTKATPNDLEELKYPSTDLPYYYGDETAFYIGMPAIEKSVCKLIPDMIASPIIGVYTIEGETLTPDKCTENIELEYAFEWGDNQELECLLDCGDHGKPDSKCLTCDCMPRFAGDYCDKCAGGWQTEEGSAIQCSECPEPFTQQGDICGCTVQGCEISNTTTDCSCAKCSTEFNYELKKPVNENGDACEPDEEDGACGWLCEAKEGNLCSYNFENSDPVQKNLLPYSCSYKFSNPDPAQKDLLPYSCSYKFSNPNPTSDAPTMTIDKPCKSNEYCYLLWSDKSCGSKSIPYEGADIIYGTCVPLNSLTQTCVGGKTTTTPTMTIDKPCHPNEYCYLLWSDKSCGSESIPYAGADIIYGTCVPVTSLTQTCVAGQTTTTPTMWAEIKCPIGQYCNLKWAKKDCSKEIPYEGSPEIFGKCAKVNNLNASTSCPVQK